VIVLDSNVLSALMRPELNPIVTAWADQQPADSLWTSAVCVFEVRYGLNIMPTGKRRDALTERFSRLIEHGLQERVLPLDHLGSVESAAIAARQKAAGRPIEVRDVLIAGTVKARHATLATRNLAHFADANIQLIDPWSTDDHL
jgi:predicted nucleic acid-binding protein